MTNKSQKWGNSVGVRVPKTILKELGLKDIFEYTICTEHRRIVLTPKRLKKIKEPTLDELLDKITPKTRHPEFDWGPAVGKEIVVWG